MDDFHPLKIEDIRRETPNATSLAFTVPANLHTFYKFKAGQYLTLRAVIDGEEVRRSYSVCVAPADGQLRVAVKHLPGGLFSTMINQKLKIGDTLDVGKPDGRFCHADIVSDAPRYVAFVAGSGITPVLSLIRTALIEQPTSRFTLFYGNRGSVDIMFLDQLAILKDIYLDRFDLYHVLSREEGEFSLLSGRMEGRKIVELIEQFVPNPQSVDRYFVCGPEAMMDDVEAVLKQKNVAPEKIVIERFGTAISHEDRAAFAERAAQASGTMMEVTWDGRKIQVPFTASAGNILDAARLAGLPAPFSCKGGVCATCRARLTHGKVEMAVHYGLTDDEIARGHILTCQAVPTTDKIALTYDA